MKQLLVTSYFAIISLLGISQCIGDITYTVDIPPAADNTYPPGTVVELCVTMTGWNGNALGSNWNEGFGLTLGPGWQSATPVTAPDDADADASGTWIWVESVTSDATGLTAGPGYFFEGPSGPTDGNPGNDWGDYCLNGDCVWTFCVELTVQVTDMPMDLHIGVTAYADGSMGSWGNESCFDPETPLFDGNIGCIICGCTDAMACNYDPDVCCDDGSCDYFSMTDITHNFVPCPDTTCIGSEVTYSVNGNETSIYDWHVTGGGLLTTDQTSACGITWGNVPGTYTISVQEITEQGCEGELKTCNVEVIVPDIVFDTTRYDLCLNGSLDLLAEPSDGYWTHDFINGNTFIGEQSGWYQPEYHATIHGCTISETIDIKVKPKYQAPPITYTTEAIDLCMETGESYYLTPDSLGYTYNWFIENVRQIELGNQLTVQWPDTSRVYLIKVIGYDEIGCESDPSLIAIQVESCQRFFAPNSFSPNNDGVNDVFEIRGMSVYRPLLKIFNRWGIELYSSSNLWWTGDSGNGYFCGNDVYNWIVEYKDKFGQSRQESGYVTLIR